MLSSREPLRSATLENVIKVEAAMDEADIDVYAEFREWMADQNDGLLSWNLHERLNFHHGVLTYSLARNHRTSLVWGMLEWIRTHAPGSYGLFYCYDDEDHMNRDAYGRKPTMDFDNVYRVHRLKGGVIEELPDPFFGQVYGDLFPVHPFDRAVDP